MEGRHSPNRTKLTSQHSFLRGVQAPGHHDAFYSCLLNWRGERDHIFLDSVSSLKGWVPISSLRKCPVHSPQEHPCYLHMEGRAATVREAFPFFFSSPTPFLSFSCLGSLWEAASEALHLGKPDWFEEGLNKQMVTTPINLLCLQPAESICLLAVELPTGEGKLIRHRQTLRQSHLVNVSVFLSLSCLRAWDNKSLQTSSELSPVSET